MHVCFVVFVLVFSTQPKRLRYLCKVGHKTLTQSIDTRRAWRPSPLLLCQTTTAKPLLLATINSRHI